MMMSERREIRQQFFIGERSLFMSSNLYIADCVFADGESPLKESHDIELEGSMFKWKYPLWYCKNITVRDCTWFEMARAGVWYTDHISVENTPIEAPKNFRRCKDVSLKNVSFSNAAETLWNCDDVSMANVTAKGDYFAMNTTNVKADHLTLYGNYSFDGSKNVEIRDSKLLSKDAFWNSENVTVYNSFISGEYLGWNSRNLTLVDCTIESLQGMCYIKENRLDFPESYIDLYRIGVPKFNLRLCNFFAAESIAGLRHIAQTDAKLWEQIERREPNAYLTLLYWDSEMFKRSTRKRRELEGEPTKDYKALCEEMLIRHPSRYFTNPSAKYTATHYRKFLISNSTFMKPWHFRRMHDALIAGDPKLRTLRALYTGVFGDYVNEARTSQEKGGEAHG